MTTEGPSLRRWPFIGDAARYGCFLLGQWDLSQGKNMGQFSWGCVGS